MSLVTPQQNTMAGSEIPMASSHARLAKCQLLYAVPHMQTPSGLESWSGLGPVERWASPEGADASRDGAEVDGTACKRRIPLLYAPYSPDDLCRYSQN